MPLYEPSLAHSPPLFTSPQPATTLVLSVLSHIDRLDSDLQSLRFAVDAGHRLHASDLPLSHPSVAAAEAVEQARIDARAWNRENVTELDEAFRAMPLRDGRSGVAVTGRWLRGLTHSEVDMLLDGYEIPFLPSMFLPEKKGLYLRFLGANRVVMHRVLD